MAANNSMLCFLNDGNCDCLIQQDCHVLHRAQNGMDMDDRHAHFLITVRGQNSIPVNLHASLNSSTVALV